MTLADSWKHIEEEPEAAPAPQAIGPVSVPSNAADRCRAYLEALPDAVSGEGGHNTTLQAACECYRFGLGDADAASVMQWFNAEKCAPPWTQRELDHKLESARDKVNKAGEVGKRLDEKNGIDGEVGSACQLGRGKPAVAGDVAAVKSKWRPELTNVRIVKPPEPDPDAILSDDGNQKEKNKIYALTPAEVRSAVLQTCGDIYTLGDGGPLFVPCNTATPPIRILKDPPDLFAWAKQSAAIRWYTGACLNGEPLGKTELVSTLRANPSASYDTVATTPHHPPMASTYYAHGELPPATGERLAEFIDRLNPETEQDRDLLKAMVMTPAYGGPAGSRPMFVISSDHGRGSGKTKTAEAVGHLFGGGLTVSLETRDGIDRLRQRLLAPSNAALRCITIDNVKSAASSGEIESLITASVIDGHRLHHGDARRANNLTWTLTANGVGLSRDLADRSVLIKLGKPQRADFVSWAWQFIDKHRLQLVADILAELRADPQSEISPAHRDRWTAWQDAVLCRLPDADNLARLIIERRGGMDQDAKDWDEVQSIIEGLVEAVGYAHSPQPVHIPTKAICDRFIHLTGQHLTGRGFATMLARFTGIGDAKRLRPNPSNRNGRGYLWMPVGGTLEDAASVPPTTYPNWESINPATLKSIHY